MHAWYHAVLYCNKQWWYVSQTKRILKYRFPLPVVSYQRRVKIKKGVEQEGGKRV
jgi:hypothetical protein